MTPRSSVDVSGNAAEKQKSLEEMSQDENP
jgi:hypothetical protein